MCVAILSCKLRYGRGHVRTLSIVLLGVVKECKHYFRLGPIGSKFSYGCTIYSIIYTWKTPVPKHVSTVSRSIVISVVTKYNPNNHEQGRARTQTIAQSMFLPPATPIPRPTRSGHSTESFPTDTRIISVLPRWSNTIPSARTGCGDRAQASWNCCSCTAAAEVVFAACTNNHLPGRLLSIWRTRPILTSRINNMPAQSSTVRRSWRWLLGLRDVVLQAIPH